MCPTQAVHCLLHTGVKVGTKLQIRHKTLVAVARIDRTRGVGQVAVNKAHRKLTQTRKLAFIAGLDKL